VAMVSSVAGVKRSFVTMALDLDVDAQKALQTTPDSLSSDHDGRAPERLRQPPSYSSQGMLLLHQFCFCFGSFRFWR
jgi:hypothetical protein